MQINSNSRVGRKGILEKDKKPFLIDQDLKPIKSEKRPFAKELFEKYYSISEKEKMATQAAQQRMEKAIGKTTPKKQIKAPAPPIKAKYPIMDWKNLPFNTAVWKESERLAGKEGYVSAFGWSEDCDFAFLPTETAGDSYKPVGDYHWQATGWRVAKLGGYWYDGLRCGLCYWDLHSTASYRYRSIGSRLVYIPTAA